MKTIIVTGGREYADKSKVIEVLDLIQPDVLVQGGATGADQLAKDWANANEVTCITVDAEWTKYGKGAGNIRNAVMLDRFPTAVVIAFPGNKGTANCVKFAKQRLMTIIKVLE